MPRIQSNPVSDPSKDFNPTEERKWIDIPADRHFKAYTLESSISKLVMKLVRHLDQGERETDGAVH